MLPAYIRIHDKIKEDVDDGAWKIGQRLPSERDLCETFDVSRMTVRQAITLLVELRVLLRLSNPKARSHLVSLFRINVYIQMSLKSRI